MGWIVAAFGIGAGAASLLLAVRGRLPRAGLVLCLSVVTGAFAVGAIAFVPTVALAAVAGLFVGLLAGLGGGLCGALTQTVTEPAYLGRVTSVATLFTLGIAPLSYPVTGAAVGLWGTGPVFVVSAAVCAAGGALGLAFAACAAPNCPAAGRPRRTQRPGGPSGLKRPTSRASPAGACRSRPCRPPHPPGPRPAGRRRRAAARPAPR